MREPTVSIRRSSLELFERLWPGAYQADGSITERDRAALADAMQEVARALRADPADSRTGEFESLPALPDRGHADEADLKYTAQDMRDYAIECVDARIVAWHFHRPAQDQGIFGLNWPQVDRIITDRQQAENAKGTIDARTPGSLRPLTSTDLVTLLRTSLLSTAKFQGDCMALHREREYLANEHSDALTALRKISQIEDELHGGDWEEIQRARDIANTMLSNARFRI